MNTTRLFRMEIRLEHDVVLSRQRAREIAGYLGYDDRDQTRIATAVSELSRNLFEYAKGGRIEFRVDSGSPGQLVVTFDDDGPGIPHIQEILEGRYRSTSGMGLGIIGAKRLTDRFEIDARENGTHILVGKDLPGEQSEISPERLKQIEHQIENQRPQDPFAEVQRQNQELIQALNELKTRQEELRNLNRELEDTNRGVVALYAELDERAGYLERASELKTRFLSNMSHEFRTPLNSIKSLARLLLDKMDGPLTSEQETQVTFIQKAAEALSELVDDLLDIAKVEAGKLTIHPDDLSVAELFSTLRGMLRPLLAYNTAVNLVFEEVREVPVLYTDASKLSQILRNFISNALKFTQQGEVRVGARYGAGGAKGDSAVFFVKDTGIGIAPDDQARIFEEFSQVESKLQRQSKGTGLGLPLSKRLASLLGGRIYIKSELGKGSTFFLEIPMRYSGPTEVADVSDSIRAIKPGGLPVLVVEDSREAMFLYEKYLKETPFEVFPARTVRDAKRTLRNVTPAVIILDILLEAGSTWEFMKELKTGAQTRDVPVFVITQLENERKALAEGADAFHAKPIERDWLVRKLTELAVHRARGQILIVDDDEIARYVLRADLSKRFMVVEASNGEDALRRLEQNPFVAVILDLMMPGMSGFDVLDQMRRDPRTRETPVIVYSSKQLGGSEREGLRAKHAIFVSKDAKGRGEVERALNSVLPPEQEVKRKMANG